MGYCGWIDKINGVNETNVSQCICLTFYDWVDTSLKCMKNCTTVSNSPGTDFNDHSCNCNAELVEYIL